jgi:predicted DNA-binding transcriptional regulator YafY
MSRTLRRYLALVRHIPPQGRRIGTDRLMAVLAGEGLAVTARTLQRDLEALQDEFTGWCSLEAHVNDSMELRGWLRSLGPLIEVLGPKKLRSAMSEDAAALGRLYAT